MRPVIAAVTFYRDYDQGIGDESYCMPPKNEVYGGRIYDMIDSFKKTYPGFKQVIDFPVVERLAECVNNFVDMERALQLPDALDSVDVAEPPSSALINDVECPHR